MKVSKSCACTYPMRNRCNFNDALESPNGAKLSKLPIAVCFCYEFPTISGKLFSCLQSIAMATAKDPNVMKHSCCLFIICVH